MSEKRFVNIGNEIYQNGEWWCSAGGEHCADVIATALNELIDDNEHLKQEIEGNISSFQENNRKRLELEKENEQLKKENQRVLDCIDEKNTICTRIIKDGNSISIKEFEKGNTGMKKVKVFADSPTINTPIMNPYLKRNVLINRGFPNHSKYRRWEFKKILRRFRSRARYHMKC